MSAPKNPFCKSQNKRKGKENLVKIFFAFATYIVVIAAFAIFGKILVEGAPVLWNQGMHFITSKPQTLFVMEVDKAQNLELPSENYDALLATNPNADEWLSDVENIKKDTSFVTFDILKGSRISSTHISDLESENKDLFIRFNQRDSTSKIGFSLPSEKKITLKADAFNTLKATAPELIPADTEPRIVKLNDYKVTINKGEYPIGKGAHDALVPTDLIFQMRQTFADDEPNKINQVLIPNTQTITIPAAVYFSAFDEEERGTLPLANEEEIPLETAFYDILLPAGDYKVAPAALAVLDKVGISHKHNLERGSVVLPKNYTSIKASTEFLKTLKTSNPDLVVSNESIQSSSESYVRFSIAKEAEVLLGTEDRLAFTNANESNSSLKISSEKTHSYSAGGILGPIVGTALLVFICMAIALFTGIAASVYLNEYANGGSFVKTVRLAMLNLAGVPSIVFGLFGLGLFVVAAPAVTSTPMVKSKITIPLVKIASKPDLRTLEQKQIYVSEKPAPTSVLAEKATAAAATRYYDGWTYLSFQGWGSSMLAGGFTLAIMVLPVIITSCEESLRAVPMGFREASLALGATKWQSIRTAVLPYAFPGILTASVLGITRVAGETAPIMFTAAVAEKSGLPGEGLKETGFDAFLAFLQESVQALPYHIYTVSGRIPQSDYVEPMQFGSVLVFMLIVMSFAGLSIWLRIRVRKKLKW